MALVKLEEVDVAAHHLNDLAVRMKCDSFGFNNSDVSHIDTIIDALHDINLHRSKALEILETETIKGAALRHKLMHFPGDINREIEGAVNAARALNEDVINDLKLQLKNLCDEIDYLESHADELDRKTLELGPHRDAIGSVYEEIVAQLNERLANKAENQISLNQNNEALRKANVGIVDYEEDIVRLHEEMVQLREQVKNKKKQLQDDTKEQVSIYNEQKARNNERRKIYNDLSEQESGVSTRLAELQSISEKLRSTNTSLQKQEADLSENIRRQQERQAQIEKEIALIKSKTQAMIEDHRKQMAELQNTLEGFQARIKRETSRKETYSAKKPELKENLEAAMVVREEDALKVREMSEKSLSVSLEATVVGMNDNGLQEAKAALAEKAEDMGQLQQEMFDMQNKIIELQEAHRSAVLMYNKQIAALKEQVSREQKERLVVQSNNDELQAQIDEFNKKQNDFMTDMNKKITAKKRLHHNLNEEHTALGCQIKTDIGRRKQLETDIDRTSAEYMEMKDTKEGIVQFLTTDLERLGDEFSQRDAELSDLQPKFQEFEEFYDKSMKEYDALKKSLVALKNRKLGLEEGSERTKLQIDKLRNSIQDLERSKERKCEQSVEFLDVQTENVQTLEKNIYVLGCKLKTVLDENARLESAIGRFERDVRSMRLQQESAVRRKARTRDLLHIQMALLREGWEDDSLLRQEFHEVDQQLLTILEDILDDSRDREGILGRITENLDHELMKLTSFLKTSDGTDDNPNNYEVTAVIDIEND